MTLHDPEVIETALESAFRRAGGNPNVARLKALIVTHRGNPAGLLARFKNEPAAWAALCEILDRAIDGKASNLVPVKQHFRTPPRNLATELAPAAKDQARAIVDRIETAFQLRDGRAIEAIYLDEARRIIGENTLEFAILRKVVHHCGGKTDPNLTIGDCVNAKTLEQFIADARKETGAP